VIDGIQEKTISRRMQACMQGKIADGQNAMPDDLISQNQYSFFIHLSFLLLHPT
jgi:hypothetical protein